MILVNWTPEAKKVLEEWKNKNNQIYKRIGILIEDIKQTSYKEPHKGIGKPERLKYKLSNSWARRITKKHRLVYEISNKEIIIISCKGHYDDK
jgi:toxin YoeB